MHLRHLGLLHLCWHRLGFYAGRDVHAVVESNYGPNLGRVILEGEAEKNTGVPVSIDGLTRERVVWAPVGGVFASLKEIGDWVTAGEVVGYIGNFPVVAPTGGILRGLLRSGLAVAKGSKIVEVDPSSDSCAWGIIAAKSISIGEGVFRAIMLKYSSENNDSISFRW